MPVIKKNPKLLDELALDVANGGSIPAWAVKHKISERTVYSWTAKPEFRAMVAMHRRRITDAVVGLLARCAKKSVVQIATLADSASAEPVRLAAARAILTELVNISGFADLEARIAQLESRGNDAKSDHQA